MDVLFRFFRQMGPAVPAVITITGVVLVMVFAQKVLERRRRTVAGSSFRNQLIMLALTFVGALVVILALPVADTLRGQLLSLVGILLSVAVALSSTTFLGNAMAGVMLRVVRNFRIGDFVRVDGNFGRVTERGLFHTEIQNEDRDLITLPNLYLVTHAVTTIRTSGTVVSAQVSLGYDVPRARVEDLLIRGAERAGLQDAFVQVLGLGDFSVTYRVAGLLTQVKHLLSARSRLRGSVLDALHEGGVEIVSPSFMNTRAVPPGKRFVPAVAGAEPFAAPPATPDPEKMVFDKADEAESLEALRKKRENLAKDAAALEERVKKAGNDEERKGLEAEGERLEKRKTTLANLIAAREKQVDQDN